MKEALKSQFTKNKTGGRTFEESRWKFIVSAKDNSKENPGVTDKKLKNKNCRILTYLFAHSF